MMSLIKLYDVICKISFLVMYIHGVMSFLFFV